MDHMERKGHQGKADGVGKEEGKSYLPDQLSGGFDSVHSPLVEEDEKKVDGFQAKPDKKRPKRLMLGFPIETGEETGNDADSKRRDCTGDGSSGSHIRQSDKEPV